MIEILHSLKDIKGIEGSFVLNRECNAVATDMPAVIAPEVYVEVGRRIRGMFEASSAHLGEFDEILLKFEDYWFCCKRSANGFLGILAQSEINFPALKMATTVALNQIDSQIPNENGVKPATTFLPKTAPAPAPAAAPTFRPPTPAPAAPPAHPAPPAAQQGSGEVETHTAFIRKRRLYRGQYID